MLMKAVQSALSAQQWYAALNNTQNSTNNKLYKILLKAAAMSHFKYRTATLYLPVFLLS